MATLLKSFRENDNGSSFKMDQQNTGRYKVLTHPIQTKDFHHNPSHRKTDQFTNGLLNTG
jgi:hypothetical protein